TMTSSSGPGLSLKQECISYMAGCELPVVIVNVMRTGPGLGNISPAQGDYFQATRGGGHGDYRTIVLAPSCVQDAGDLTYDAFDLADKYRTPVMLLLDGMIGQMREPFELREYKQKENYDKSWALTGCKGRQQNIVRSFYMQWSDSQKLSQRLVDRYETIQRNETRAECFLTDDADLIVVAYGTPARMAKSAITKLRGQGVKVGLFRPITLWPYPEKELQRVAKHASDILVIEWSAGQMIEDVKLSLGNSNKIHFFGKIGGALTDADEIEQKIDEIFIKNGV
ncbi:3-methyl-2-oxobutanoate dehydrogenase subunit beta, partial [bacterium]|nr:3-methyl-2-oxobutanoate dehydrogenase subunit beta [bacterium]